MSGLVLELQNAAMDSNVKVADVLRRALVVTKKLRIPTIEQWISHELDGYGASDVPDYRKLVLALRVWNPYHGYQPLVIAQPEFAEMLSNFALGQALPQLEKLLDQDNQTLQVPFTSSQEATLMSAMAVSLRPTRIASRTQVEGIVDAVRNQILTWALELEAQGVIGAGMTFSAKEQQAAHQVTNIINHIGSMQNSQLQQASPHASQSQQIEANATDLAALIDVLERTSMQGMATDDVAELRADIATLRAQSESPKPKATMIQEGLKSVRTILERAAGSVITAEALPLVTALMHRLSI